MEARSSGWFSRNSGSPGGTYSPYTRYLTGDELPLATKWMVISCNGASGGFFETQIATNPLLPGQNFIEDLSVQTKSGGGMSLQPISLAVNIPTNPFGGIGLSVKHENAAFSGHIYCIVHSDLGFPTKPATFNQSSGAKNLTLPAVSDVLSPWVELIPSLNFEAIWMCLMVQFFDGFANHGVNMKYDIGLGPAGFESVVIPQLGMNFFTSVNIHDNSRCFNMPVDFALGSRISLRAQKDDGANVHTMELGFGMVVYG